MRGHSGAAFGQRQFRNSIIFETPANGRSRLNPPFGEAAADGRIVPALSQADWRLIGTRFSHFNGMDGRTVAQV